MARYTFKKNATIGAADGIDDKSFLAESFVDNGSIDTLCDFSKPEFIIVGRTGAGKTALIEKLQN